MSARSSSVVISLKGLSCIAAYSNKGQGGGQRFLSPRDGLTIFVSRFYTEHTPLKMPDVGSRRQWCLKTINVLNFDHDQHNSRDEKHSDNHRSYFAK
jgi:hypothetical protein